MPGPPSNDEALLAQIRRLHAALGLSPGLTAGRTRGPSAECADLVPVGPDVYGRDQQLERNTAAHWQTMLTAARSAGVELQLVSAFRSHAYQAGIFSRKLAAGQTVDQILRVNALPGYSEHHTGRAVDLGTPGCPHLTEAFAGTAAYRWLEEHAAGHGFVLSFPRDNPHGIAFEPWHWCWQLPAPGRQTNH